MESQDLVSADFTMIMVSGQFLFKLGMMAFEKRFNFDLKAVNAGVSASIVKPEISDKTEVDRGSLQRKDMENQADM